MHGNVKEMCSDWYDSNYYKKFRNVTAADPPGPAQGSLLVVRGGNWSFDYQTCYSWYRDWSSPREPCAGLGFRVVRSAAK
jgi:formylglycine-generating enzyme required for sulfatase activity